MVDPRRIIRNENPSPEAPCEWLVANGLGGYASATIAVAITRRYHGFLIAAQPAALGRMVVLNDLEVDIERADGGSVVNLRENG
jgi:glycogen debranching enzyme